MTSSYTTNKHLEQPGNGDYVGNWNVPVNADWTTIDNALGGVQPISLTGSSGTITLSATSSPSYVPLILSLSGVPTSAVNIQFPSGVGGEWVVINACTGTYSSVTFSNAAGGATTVVPAGQIRSIVSVNNPTGYGVIFADSQTTVAGSTTQVIYNSSGTLVGSSNLTFDGTNLTAGGTIKSSSGGFIFPDSTTQTTAATIPSGSMTLFAASTPPSGWLECNGSLVSTTTYARLYAVVGTTFGSGSGTFGLPDMRGYFARGWDHGAGVDPGRTFGSTQADSFASHTHAMPSEWIVPNASGSSTPGFAQGGSYAYTAYGTGPTLAAGGTETRPKNVALMYIIKT